MPDNISKEVLRARVEQRIDDIVSGMNGALKGGDITKLEPVLKRIGRGAVLPHWYDELRAHGKLPNLDGKSIGSVLEMLFVAVVETEIIGDLTSMQLRVNPARGVDLPDLDLGIKSPSENYCTSEPFYSAYERLVGSSYDIVVLITDYQTAKKTTPLQLQIINSKYLRSTQVADRNLCAIARKHREWLLQENEPRAQKFFKFLAYVNQSDWLAKHLLRMIDVLDESDKIDSLVQAAAVDFDRKNAAAAKLGREGIPDEDLEYVHAISAVQPRHLAVLEAADNWVVRAWKEAGRSPSMSELNQLKSGPLDGSIGMSFALQWRYLFGGLFGAKETEAAQTRLL